jgi:hypothetical protein
MRWIWLFGFVAGCGSKESPPAWSPEVQAAMSAMDAAVKGSPGAAVSASARLRDALMKERQNDLVRNESMRMLAILEVEVEGETQAADVTARWKEIRDRLTGVPRQVQKQVPQDKKRVLDAVDAVDQALAGGDGAAGRRALGEVKAATAGLAQKLPLPIQNRLGGLINEELEALDSALLGPDIGPAKTMWQAAKKKLLALIE